MILYKWGQMYDLRKIRSYAIWFNCKFSDIIWREHYYAFVVDPSILLHHSFKKLMYLLSVIMMCMDIRPTKLKLSQHCVIVYRSKAILLTQFLDISRVQSQTRACTARLRTLRLSGYPQSALRIFLSDSADAKTDLSSLSAPTTL